MVPLCHQMPASSLCADHLYWKYFTMNNIFHEVTARSQMLCVKRPHASCSCPAFMCPCRSREASASHAIQVFRYIRVISIRNCFHDNLLFRSSRGRNKITTRTQQLLVQTLPASASATLHTYWRSIHLHDQKDILSTVRLQLENASRHVPPAFHHNVLQMRLQIPLAKPRHHKRASDPKDQ
jgi:hypothetical protein